MSADDESRRERLVAAFAVAFAVGVTAPLPAVLPSSADGTLAASAGVAIGVGAVVVAGVRQAEALLDGLARPRYLFVPGVATVGWTVGAFVLAPPVQVTALLPFAIAYAGCVLGSAAWILARDAYDRSRRASATTVASFEAPPPPRIRRRMRLGGVITVAGGLVGAASMALGGDVVLTFTFFPLASSGGAFALLARTDRDVRVTDEGLFVNRSRRSWSDFEDARVEDGVLFVTSDAWFGGTLRLDATEIEDVDGVVAAINERVLGSDSSGEPDDGRARGQSSPDS
jgi:hypothetical protein